MAVVFREWLNTNEGRSYPIHDKATLISTSGTVLPDNLIVDANILIPSVLGTNLYVSSVGVSKSLITVTFFASDYNPINLVDTPSFSPACVITLLRPVIKYKNYPVTPLYPGVGGWISFGNGVESDNDLSLLFSGPEATLLLDRCVKSYTELPVSSIGKLNDNKALTGVISLRGVKGITKTAKDVRIINGEEVNAVTIGLDVETNKVSTLQNYAGVCGHRPQVGTCNKKAITSINGVFPDANGNIDIEFIGDEIVTDTQDGLLIDYPLGLEQTCVRDPIKSILDVVVECETSSTSLTSPETPEEPSYSSESGTSDSSYETTISSYYSENFSDSASEYTVVKGSMEIVNVPNEDVVTTNKRFVTLPGVLGDENYAINFDKVVTIFNTSESFLITAIIHPRDNSEGHLIFGYKSNTNFFYAGLTLLGAPEPTPGYLNGRLFIGKRNAIDGPAWATDLGKGYNFLAGCLYSPPVSLDSVDYYVQILVTNIGGGIANINMFVEWDDMSGANHIVNHSTNTPFNMTGYVGFGSVDSAQDSVTEFDDVVLDAPRLGV